MQRLQRRYDLAPAPPDDGTQEATLRTDEKLDELCDTLIQNCGDIHDAARSCGVSPAFILRWQKDDETAADKLREAQQVGWLGLESEARRRAVDGVEKSVWYRGEEVGSETVYSDGLLGKLLEARVPAYKKGEGANAVFNGPTQINMMPRATNYDEWLAMRDTTLERRDAEKSLPAPTVPDILQGDYVDVTPVKQGMAILEGLL